MRRRRVVFTLHKIMQTFGQIFLLSWRTSPMQVMLLFLLQGLQGGLPFATGWITKNLFDFITQSDQKHQLFWQGMLWLLIAQGIVFLLNQLLTPTTSYLNADLGRGLTLNARQRIYQKLNSIDGLACFEDPSFHSTIEMVSRNVQYIPSQTLSMFGGLLQGMITICTFMGILLALSPWLTGMICLSVVPQFLVQIKFGQQRFNLLFSNSGKERHASYYGQVISWVAYAKEVRLFQLGDYFLQRFVTTTREIHQSQRTQQQRELRWQLVFALIASLATVGAYALVLWQVFHGEISLGDVALYISAVASVQGALESGAFLFSRVNDSLLFFNQYNQLLHMEQPLKSTSPSRPVPPLTSGITLRDVSFRYSEQHPWILRHIDLFLPLHECLALVGLNGAGKTTLVKLLTRLYDPTEGQILWDTIDIREFEPCEYRQHIGTIFQDFARYELSAYENIGLGNIEQMDQEQVVYQAAQKAGIHTRIETLPEGYQSILSRWMAEEQDGVDLSGGEWQKLALARMFVRQADILILDEPTAALDAQAEYELYHQFRHLMQGHTSILITHRFSTIRMADRIAVLEQGSIHEVGTHEELQAKNGLYAKLYHMQAEKYQE